MATSAPTTGSNSRSLGFGGTGLAIDADGSMDLYVLGKKVTSFSAAGLSSARKQLMTAKTADYTVVEADSGKVFTTLGATGAVNFTLPDAAGCAGWDITFVNAADQNMTVTGATTDQIVAFNDLAADSIAFSTASEKIGSGVRMLCDGTKWYALPILGAETATPTIAT